MTPEDLDVVKAQIDAKIQEKMGERSDAVKPDNDLEKFMYDKNYEELKLSREWAIKVSVFTSAVYFGVITLANSETGKAIVTGSYRISITILLAVFAGLGIWNIILRHFSYLEYRNIQIRLQNDLGIHSWSHDNGNVFLETWKKDNHI